jgi:hypothetical protein
MHSGCEMITWLTQDNQGVQGHWCNSAMHAPSYNIRESSTKQHCKMCSTDIIAAKNSQAAQV